MLRVMNMFCQTACNREGNWESDERDIRYED
jgi:hypothetical protein